MEPLQKLDWIPLYLHRLKASRTWAMPDFQWCWFMKLIIELAGSETPGYLPNDVDVLWRLARARTMDLFLKRDGAGLVDREFRRTADGLRIYNARLLEVLKEQNEKLHRKKQPAKEKTLSLSGLGFSSIKNEDLKAPVYRLFSYYQEILERDARYKLTERRAEQCERRLIECLQAGGGGVGKAEASAQGANFNPGVQPVSCTERTHGLDRPHLRLGGSFPEAAEYGLGRPCGEAGVSEARVFLRRPSPRTCA